MKKILMLFMTICIVSVSLILSSCINSNVEEKVETESVNQEITEQTDLFDPETLIAMTKFGPVQGGALGDGSLENPSVYAWIKIPYAKPPVGELMFKAPQDPEPWVDPLDCSTYDITVDDYPIQWDWAYFTNEEKVIGTLDCLYLNVWRPQTPETNLPVQVDIHGGSSVNWSGLDSNEWQDYVNETNVIVVAPNYRLGPWGNFSHPALKTGDPLDDSGNFAILDQIKVLQWIQDNIEAFGGDPGNVTLSGQSSGGLHVSMLLHSPLAKDLFHKVIISSPALQNPAVQRNETPATIEEGNAAADQILVNLLIYDHNDINTSEEARAKIDGMSTEEIAAYLRDKFTNDPLLVFTAVNNGTPDRPSKSNLYKWGFVDGYVVNESIDWDPSSGNFYPKPMIIGDTEADMYANYPAQKDSGGIEIYNYTYDILYGGEIVYETYDEAIQALVPLNEITPGGWKNYSVEDFKEKYDIASDALLRSYDIIGVQNPARGAASAPELDGKVFVYRQDWGSNADPNVDNVIPYPYDGFYQFTIGADHSSDLWAMYDWNDIKGPAWFETWTRAFVFTDENYAGRKDLADKVQAYLGAFLHSSDGTIPKTDKMPIVWEPWTDDKEQFITWNATADKAVFEMNDLTFTGESLQTYLNDRIDALSEATDKDKAALKEWVNTQLTTGYYPVIPSSKEESK